jgi:hypothetical protein
VIAYGKGGEIAANRRDEQEMFVLYLRTLQSAAGEVEEERPFQRRRTGMLLPRALINGALTARPTVRQPARLGLPD